MTYSAASTAESYHQHLTNLDREEREQRELEGQQQHEAYSEHRGECAGPDCGCEWTVRHIDTMWDVPPPFVVTYGPTPGLEKDGVFLAILIREEA